MVPGLWSTAIGAPPGHLSAMLSEVAREAFHYLKSLFRTESLQ
jgi:hypothetical protein